MNGLIDTGQRSSLTDYVAAERTFGLQTVAEPSTVDPALTSIAVAPNQID
jgi:hypothetical protein